jgi:hypothetical protein
MQRKLPVPTFVTSTRVRKPCDLREKPKIAPRNSEFPDVGSERSDLVPTKRGKISQFEEHEEYTKPIDK